MQDDKLFVLAYVHCVNYLWYGICMASGLTEMPL